MARTSHPADPLDQAQLAGFGARKRERARLEVEDLLEALDWALRHPAAEPEPYAAARAVADQGWLAPTFAESDEDPWTPAVDWAAFAPLAAAMGRPTTAGKALVNDALVLAVRLPLLFEAVRSGDVEVWRARRIAQAVRMRPIDVANFVDAEVTPIADSIGSTRLEALIDQAMLRLHAEERELEIADARESYGVELFDSFHGFHGGGSAAVAELRICGDVKDLAAFEATASTIARILGDQQRQEGVFPESLEVRKARAIGILADPQLALELLHGGTLAGARTVHGIQLVVHLTPEQAKSGFHGFDPIAKIEGRLGTRLAEQVADWCARPEASLSVLPVIDLNDHTSSRSDDVTDKMAIRAKLRTSTCVFPFCDRPARICDVDHLIPTGDGPGQHGSTCDCNLVPLCRHHHRLKTHAGWSYTPIEEAVWLWSDPHGRSYVRDHHSTRDVTAEMDPPDPGVDWVERRDEVRRRRIPVRTGCRVRADKDDDPPPF